MRTSLKVRLIVLLSLSLVVLVTGVALVLERAFERSLVNELKQRMESQLYVLLTAAEEQQPGILYIPEVVRDANFNQIDSGRYAFAYDGHGEELWRSFSAIDLEIDLAEVIAPGEIFFDQMNINGVDYYRLRYSVIWESIDESEHYYLIVILYDAKLLQLVIEEFRLTLWSGLGFVLIAMLLIQFLALRWGLSPLNLIASDLENIELGKQNILSSTYPTELLPLANNLNLLIEAERAQREKYRNTMSNLAHSLKTPLAVIRGELGGLNADRDTLNLLHEQVNRMDEIIQYQLHRAVAGQQGHMLASVNIRISLEKIIQALDKVYQHKNIKFDLECDDQSRFYGDEGDFMEIMGNLIDNACKWTHNRIVIRVISEISKTSYKLTLDVLDNGPGVEPSKRADILKRGQKLDEKVEGQGIGLSVVAELVHQYGGEISILDGELGGADFRLKFNFKRA
jgi:two-component system sensor histidine kinase PhoQ